ncbi:glycosyltransferase [Motiliproteus sp. MSK22-1]|uniref:glycosyltransferase n=1 Tax=Motiliproteus sp. MSK22-1 TaxID=1897630 RepID=UPI0009753D06|nr:hypothetical protein [Motiliproteus sp. MSK22-1]OMH38966.1 hypothetical protein BGP75_04365 [Motiliproteus sp. MSK22-1]
MTPSKHIVFAWELGAGYGHITSFMPIAKEMRRRGYRVSWILKDISNFPNLSNNCDDKIFQAPVYTLKDKGLETVNNYSDLLYRHGYRKADELVMLLHSWELLFDQLDPDLLICDHSPTALLASRGYECSVASIGIGFFCPPCCSPLPSLQLSKRISIETLQQSDATVLSVINSAMESLGRYTLPQVSSLFDIDEHFLCTFPELDHYPQRKDHCYWGAYGGGESGEVPVWPEGNGPRVFVYLQKDRVSTEYVLKALDNLGWPAIVHFTRGFQSPSSGHVSETINYSAKHLDIEKVCQSADFIICHASHGTVSMALLAGIPLLLFPAHQEQLILSHRLRQYGLGLVGECGKGVEGVIKQLQELKNSTALKERSLLFAKKYSEFCSEEQIKLLADRCEQLIKKPPSLDAPC